MILRNKINHKTYRTGDYLVNGSQANNQNKLKTQSDYTHQAKTNVTEYFYTLPVQNKNFIVFDSKLIRNSRFAQDYFCSL